MNGWYQIPGMSDIWYFWDPIFLRPDISETWYFWDPIFLRLNISETQYFWDPIFLMPNISDYFRLFETISDLFVTFLMDIFGFLFWKHKIYSWSRSFQHFLLLFNLCVTGGFMRFKALLPPFGEPIKFLQHT